MPNQFSRTQLLLGNDAMVILQKSRVAVFGIGGVGSFTVEALARSGVGTIDIFDDDKVCLTNINRQLIATTKTVGQYKVDVMKNRILEINPHCIVNTHSCYYSPDVAHEYDFSIYSYIVDAIDTVTSKIQLILSAQENDTPIISCMGAGNKLDPTAFEVTDIYKTSVCPLAKVMRKELKNRGVKKLKVVYSKEPAKTPQEDTTTSCKINCVCPPGSQRNCTVKRQVPGSTAFVPSVAGLIIAGEVIKDLTGIK